jgi:hypothetical protein
MCFVDVERGRRDGIAMAKELEEAEALEASVHSVQHEGEGPIHLVDDEREGR